MSLMNSGEPETESTTMILPVAGTESDRTDAAQPHADTRELAGLALEGSSATTPAHPTVRWGALVWSLIFGTTAATTLWILIDPARSEAVGRWLTTLSPFTAGLSAIIVVGVVVALFGIVGLIRRGERARR
ncbi:hypothetical protein ASE14_14445 [Agromyces sp. Root81]|uniref:hypothetical protein n=1 Tax=Agromyces sp. Root81 TaxID=1736601 RepID=UPI0006F2A930|nr:hypothetical protein [Agromyces sp. Root81]KRC61968.1 hypothetical protein ASE14_14445 [Agromyces sp. Root81]